jgi:hypothetical protein
MLKIAKIRLNKTVESTEIHKTALTAHIIANQAIRRGIILNQKTIQLETTVYHIIWQPSQENF